MEKLTDIELYADYEAALSRVNWFKGGIKQLTKLILLSNEMLDRGLL